MCLPGHLLVRWFGGFVEGRAGSRARWIRARWSERRILAQNQIVAFGTRIGTRSGGSGGDLGGDLGGNCARELRAGTDWCLVTQKTVRA